MNTEFLTQPGAPRLSISDRAIPSWERLPGAVQTRILQTLSSRDAASRTVIGEPGLLEVLVQPFRVYYERRGDMVTIVGVVTPREAHNIP